MVKVKNVSALITRCSEMGDLPWWRPANSPELMRMVCLACGDPVYLWNLCVDTLSRLPCCDTKWIVFYESLKSSLG